MQSKFIPCDGAKGFRLSNPSALLVACVRASLDIFDEVFYLMLSTFNHGSLKIICWRQAGMDKIREKSKLQTAYLQYLLETRLNDKMKIITPLSEEERGCQMSILFDQDVEAIKDKLASRGIICDIRKPNVLRVAPVPLYNSFTDIYLFVLALGESLS